MARCRPASRPDTSVSGWVEAYVADAISVVGPGSSPPIERSSSQAVMPSTQGDDGGNGEESTRSGS